MAHRLEPDLDCYWVFDTATKDVGKLAEAYRRRGDGTKDYRRVHAYDGLSRPSTTTLDADYTQTHSYDGFGRLVSTSHVCNTIRVMRTSD